MTALATPTQLSDNSHWPFNKLKEKLSDKSDDDDDEQSHNGSRNGNGVDGQTLQDEKDFITAYEERQEVLKPSEIAQDAKNKLLGSSSHNLSVHDFQLMKTVGTGTFARVWLARFADSKEEDNDKVFALKVLRKVDVIKLKQVEHVRNERNNLGAVAGHPFITTLITSFSDDQCLYMLLNYCPGGEVFSYLRKAKRFPERPHTVLYAAEIVLVLEFLHNAHGIAYRDLKPENILLDAEGHIKIVDFGFAKEIHDRETYTLCGTPEYLAPEVIKNSGHGKAVDWWALGILIYEFIVGQPPFWDSNPLRIYEQIVAGRLRFPSPSHSLKVSESAKDLIQGLCKVEPTERLGYIAGGAQRVKDHEFFRGINWEDIYYKRAGKGPILPKVEWAGDAGNFDDYPDPPSLSDKDTYTDEMRENYEDSFKDF
ncbi:putative serine threonine-protein kinase prkx [Phaeomoniella chlamydospora]|uniref:cAMP-dependent protein kinase n=1 Tax=Phaeomoniella chlamydospora TaxID=158046 RepID=A0A0G2EH56_PHACM|nr:putative serine threonine-protein kinase prkx [Phaeomoniella chlamydospora]